MPLTIELAAPNVRDLRLLEPAPENLAEELVANVADDVRLVVGTG